MATNGQPSYSRPLARLGRAINRSYSYLYVMPDRLARESNFDGVCRICSNFTTDLQNLFAGEGIKLALVDKINKYLPIKVKKDDGLPQSICSECHEALIAWDELGKQAKLADTVMRRRLRALSPHVPRPSAAAGTSSRNGKSKSRRESFDSYRLPQHELNITNNSNNCTIIEKDSYDCLGSDDGHSEFSCRSPSENDDIPLSDIASKISTETYNKFYEALVNFRNHFVNEHKSQEYSYPDFTDSNCSEDDDKRDTEELDVNSYDDLTLCNMRKDRMDEETKLELNEVRTKLNGKVYYTCKTCGKSLSSSHTYLFHKRIHTGERPCVCHVCGKQFRTPSGLQRHLTDTHERVRRYSCYMCPKKFINFQNLKQHYRIHTGERPFECSQCGKGFTQSATLHVHLKTHSEQFPHQCTECGAKFRLKSGLTRHILKHTGERPHVCAHCGKGFRQKHELNGHVMSHTDAKPYSCDMCGAAFRLRKALRHHCKRAHEGEAVPQLAYNQIPPY